MVPKRPMRPQGGPRRLQDGLGGLCDGSKSVPKRGTRTDISRPRPQEAPRRPQEAQERPPRGPNRLQNGPQDAAKLLPRGLRESHHEIPTNTQEPSGPQPRHGGGTGRKPLDILLSYKESHWPSGCRWSRAFLLVTSFLPLFGEVYIPPPPWVWTGSPTRCQNVLLGPRWLQEGLGERKMASKMAQDTSRWLKIASDAHPRGLKTAPRRFQVPSEPSKNPPKRPTSFNNLMNIHVFAFSLFRFRWGLEASRWPQDGPREPQEGPKKAPRRPQERPRAPQEGLKRRCWGL